MQDSTERSLTQPVAGEAHSDRAKAVHSEDQNAAPQKVVPANLVEIYPILKPASPDEEEETEQEEETEDETDDEEISPGENR